MSDEVKLPSVYGLAYVDLAGKFESWEKHDGVRWLNTWPKTYIAAVNGVPVDLIAAAKAEAIMELVEYVSLSGPCLDGEADEFLNARGYKTLADQLAGKGVEGAK